MKPMGGFFDLEIPALAGSGPHPAAVALSTGRACLALWIREARPTRCYVPFYCCDALFEPLQAARVPFKFYGIDDQLCPKGLPMYPEKDEWLIWTNFFGLSSSQLNQLRRAWGNRILVDNTHAFFDANPAGLWSFTSARKYFGVPDGAYCYRPDGDFTPPADVERHVPANALHLVARYTKLREDAFALYRASEDTLDCTLQRISVFSERLLAAVDVNSVIEARATNYAVLVDNLSACNAFQPVDLAYAGSAFCYPFLPPKAMLRSDLYARNLFIPTLWPDVLGRKQKGFVYERKLSDALLPLPIDHRYQPEDMLRLARIILEYL